jgi:hypothetical protein
MRKDNSELIAARERWAKLDKQVRSNPFLDMETIIATDEAAGQLEELFEASKNGRRELRE